MGLLELTINGARISRAIEDRTLLVDLLRTDLGLTGKQKVRDLWRQKDVGDFTDSFTASVPRHGVVLVRIWPAK